MLNRWNSRVESRVERDLNNYNAHPQLYFGLLNCSIKLDWKLTYIHEGVNRNKNKTPFIDFKLCSCLHYLNLRKAFHRNHYCKLKTDLQLVNIFNCN